MRRMFDWVGSLFKRPASIESPVLVDAGPARYEVTANQLRRIMPLARGRENVYAGPLNRSMARFDINTKLRAAAYLAQIAHESGELKYSEEIASGAAYEGRMDLGNTERGDGRKFKGRGPIQTTGRNNYRLASIALFGDERLLEHPELLSEVEYGCMASAYFWFSNGCNEVADTGDFDRTTIIVNGRKPNGVPQRRAYYQQCLRVLT